MQKLFEILEQEVKAAFAAAGYDEKYGTVTVSNRPDLCEYQCNGGLAGAREYHRAPLKIAGEVAACLSGSRIFSSVEAVPPGFINVNLKADFLADYLNQEAAAENLGITPAEDPQTVLVDYGGPNVAKPLHVGHLRSAIIGESVKRIARKAGHKVLGDIHLGDWGYQMGLIITEVHERRPELPYFDESFNGTYPDTAPFTISELEEIYPTASQKAKEDEDYKAAALHATYLLQHGQAGYRALWQQIMKVSVADLKQNYQRLNVEFDLWKGESDAQAYIPEMVERLRREGYAHEDEGALIVDVTEAGDAKEIPPCIILKSDGASLYSTTDLATLVQREADYHPDSIVYLADKRQDMHFLQVFRTAKKTGIVRPKTALHFLGFGTMNGEDGHPFKTREGGVMRLETLIGEITEEMYQKIKENRTVADEEAEATARIVGMAALKYGDLSNQAAKDYIFSIDRFTSFEGNTGPYILYTIVRIKSILNKYRENGGEPDSLAMSSAVNAEQKHLMLELAKYNEVIETAFTELAPHKICAYIYNIANAFNKFYHETKILSEADETRRKSFLALLRLTQRVLEDCIDLLGFEAPERM